MYRHQISQMLRICQATIVGLRGMLSGSHFRVCNPWFLNRSQWFSEEEIRALQLEGLKQLVDHARKNTKYYKNLPRIRSLDDLEKIPILTKRGIRQNFDRLRAWNIPGHKVATSGTISRSVTIKDNRLSSNFDFSELRFKSWYRSPLKKVCKFWTSREIGLTPRLEEGHLFLPSDNVRTREDAIRYLRLIEQYKPDLIMAYATPLRLLAHYALKEGITPKVGLVRTGCEILFPEARRDIEEAFQCEVYNFYGSIELGSMAQDCEVHGDLHINAERYIVEEVDGRLIFTDLLNYAMPLIRYENQDTGELSDRRCPCGRGLPTLKSVIGRTVEYLLSKKGEWISLNILAWIPYSYDGFDWVEACQYKQLEKGKVMVLLKPWSDSEKIPPLDELKRFYYERVPQDELDISIKLVNSVILRSGKQIRILSNFSPWNS